jgi:hypothetical protein
MNERELMFPKWQVQYFDAISDGPSETLGQRVEDAEDAILRRLEQLAGGPEREMERFAINDALAHSCQERGDVPPFSRVRVEHHQRLPVRSLFFPEVSMRSP